MITNDRAWETIMTDDKLPEDQADRHGTFDSFVSATKWAVILISLALILMAVFLV